MRTHAYQIVLVDGCPTTPSIGFVVDRKEDVMRKDEEPADVLLQLAARLRENQIFGSPVERDGVTVVPVARIRAGGGLGGARGRDPHQTNGGFGFTAQPAGAWIVAETGKVQWQPAVDVSRIAIVGQLVAALLVIITLLTRRNRGRLTRDV